MGLKVALGSQPINQPPLGSEYAPAVRPIARKTTVILNPGILAANLVYASPWYDTNVTGDNFVTVRCLAVTAGSISNGLALIETDDPGSAGSISTVGSPLANLALMQVVNTGTTLANTETAVSGFIRSRFWRVVYSNGGSLSGTIFLSATSSNAGAFLFGQGAIAASAVVQNLPVAILQNGSTVDAVGSYAAYSSNNTGSQQAGLLSIGNYLFNGSSFDRQRTPTIFMGAVVQANFSNVWVPQIAKKVRLLKYRLEVGEDATISSGPLPLQLGWNWILPAITTPTGTSPVGILPTISHRFVAPSAVLATSGMLFDSGWVDLGNGFINPAASTATNLGTLQLGLCAIQPITTTVNPTWTIASNQWEASTIGFKSVANLGGARLRQAQVGIGVASAASASLDTRAGNTIIVIVRTTNIAGGAPTITVTDTQANSYSNLAQNTNATDGANGSTLQISYFINLPASLANTITATTSVHAATITDMIVLEVSGITAVGITGQSAATGNSTAPAAGTYAPGEAGDYLVNAFATAASLASQPVMATAGFTPRCTVFTANGALCVVDNFGNGALSAGGVQVSVVGTEE